MPTNYKVSSLDGRPIDFEDLFIKKSLFSTGGLWLWGNNSYGGLGNNSNGAFGISSPVQTVAGGSNWKEVSLGQRFDFASGIKTDGTLWLWGFNYYGGLGNNSTIRRSSPVQTVSGGTNWKQVTHGWTHTAAIKTDGTLWLWGENGMSGALGTNTTLLRSSPVQTISGGTNWKQVSCGWLVTATIKTDGTLWMWGLNDTGQLGDGAASNKSSPVQTVAGGTNWRQVSISKSSTAAIKTDGTLWLWGFNNYGQLGDDTRIWRSSPVQTVAGGTNWKQVASGSNFTAAIKTDGTLWTWGDNRDGGLGNNATTRRSSPVQTVSGGTNWKLVAAGYGSGCAAIKTDGTLWTWGGNFYGELGDNLPITKRSSPVQTVAGGTNWSRVATGYGNNAAIREDFY